MKHKKIIFLLLFLFSVPAFAQEKTEDECIRLHPEITSPSEMVTCTSDLESSKQKLESAYQDLYKITDQTIQPYLEQAQKAWLSFREAQCLYQGGYRYNTMGSSDAIWCEANLNRSRAKEFEETVARYKSNR